MATAEEILNKTVPFGSWQKRSKTEINMKTLKEIKDEVAKKYGHPSWSAVKNMCFKGDISGSLDMEAFMNEVAETFAAEVAEQALKDAAINARMKLTHNGETESLRLVMSCTKHGCYEINELSILQTEIKLL